MADPDKRIATACHNKLKLSPGNATECQCCNVQDSAPHSGRFNDPQILIMLLCWPNGANKTPVQGPS